MQAGPTVSQRRLRALALLASSVLLALAMMWGLAQLIDSAGIARPEPAPQRTEIALVDPPSPNEARPAPPQFNKAQARPKPKVAVPVKPAEKKPDPKQPEPKKPKPQTPKQRLKMVEQDPDQSTPPPENPDYLSNVDRKVKDQTRAKNAQLDSKRPTAKPRSQKPQKPKVAARKQKERRAEPAKTKGSPLLKMRGAASASAPASSASDALEARKDGQLQNKSQAAPSQAPKGSQGQDFAQRPRLALGGSMAAMQAAVAPQAASEGTQRFKPPQEEGLWDKARKSYQSPLDNVVPEVRVGNQTALNSRRHPFAQYIAEMHRSIHAVWGDGVLRRWDRLPPNHDWNDFTLWTRVEIVLWPSGEIDSVKTVRRSGNSSFDGVARNSVYGAGPYPPAPESIQSGNGKVYIHWAFHRNAYACGTFGAEPFILDNAGHGPRPDPNAPIDEGGVPSETRQRVYGPASPTR